MSICVILERQEQKKLSINICIFLGLDPSSKILWESVVPTCQTGKKKRIKYGHLPAKVAESYPWEHLCVDTIGPYIIRRKGKKELHFQAVTMIDPATGWFEMKQTKTKQADEVANHIETQWLSRYPWPQQITFDAGPE